MSDKMNILVTGGTGLIGQRLLKALCHHQLTVLTRSTDKARKRVPNGVSLVSSLHEIPDFSLFDAVINLAGEPIADKRWTALQKQRICQSRWDLTEQLVSRINSAENPPSVLISGSAIGYYGRQGDTLVTEEYDNVHQEFTHDVCAKWEQLAMKAETENTRVCLLRTGVVLDKHEGALPKMALPVKLGVGGKISTGDQYLSWIHIEDMVAGILHLLQHGHCRGAYNLTAPEPTTNKMFTHCLGNTLHRPTVFTVPAFVLKLLLGDAADMILTGQRVIPKRLSDDGFSFQYPTLETALNAIYH